MRLNQLQDKYALLSKKFALPDSRDRMGVSGFRPVKAILPKVAVAENSILSKPVSGKHFALGVGSIDLLVPSEVDLVDVRVIAGNGTTTPFRAASTWAEKFGGKPNDWQKLVGIADGKYYSYEIHWVQHNDVKYGLKIKRSKRR